MNLYPYVHRNFPSYLVGAGEVITAASGASGPLDVGVCIGTKSRVLNYFFLGTYLEPLSNQLLWLEPLTIFNYQLLVLATTKGNAIPGTRGVR